MARKEPAHRRTLTLPPSVSSPVDVGRLANELDLISETLLQLGLRHGKSEAKLPKTSHFMDQVAERNKLSLLKEDDRLVLKKYLELMVDKAPRLHFSFGTDPSADFMEKLVDWLRREIHPHVLVTVGLQPAIGAGCVVRSTNKHFDFSLGQNFAKQRDVLISQLLPKGSAQV